MFYVCLHAHTAELSCFCVCVYVRLQYVATLAKIPGACRWRPNMPAVHTQINEQVQVRFKSQPGVRALYPGGAASLQPSWTESFLFFPFFMPNWFFDLNRSFPEWNGSIWIFLLRKNRGKI